MSKLIIQPETMVIHALTVFICDQYQITEAQLKGTSRVHPLGEARNVMLALLTAAYPKASRESVGAVIGMSRSRVHWALKQSFALWQTCEDFNKNYSSVESRFQIFLLTNNYKAKTYDNHQTNTGSKNMEGRSRAGNSLQPNY